MKRAANAVFKWQSAHRRKQEQILNIMSRAALSASISRDEP